MTACIDASVLTKLLLKESDSAVAKALVLRFRDGASAFVVPPIALPECVSAVHQRLRAEQVPPTEAYRGIALLESMLREHVVPVPLAVRTLEIAAELQVRYPYDSMYLALAEALDCDLWTADAAFHKVASPAYPRVRLLSEFEG